MTLTSMEVNVVIATLSLIPAIVLIKQYWITKVGDYLLFALFFISAGISMFASVLAALYDHLVAYQVHYVMWVVTFSLLYLHIARVKWSRPPIVPTIIVFVWGLVLIILIGMWQLETQPQSVDFLSISIPATYSSYYPQGAGIHITHVVFFGTAHALLIYIFSFGILVFLYYVYATLEPITSSDMVTKVRRLWLLACMLITAFYIWGLPWIPHYEFQGIFLVLGLLVLSYIALFIPEGMLITNVQLIRAQHLYNKVMTIKKEKTKDMVGMKSIIDYLHGIEDHIDMD